MAVRRAGIESGRDLPEFDHRGFWQKRLQFYDVDRRRLGRMINNRSSGKKRRAPAIKQTGQISINLDGRTGEVLVRSFETMQELIDHFKTSHKIHQVLVPILTDVLLPG